MSNSRLDDVFFSVCLCSQQRKYQEDFENMKDQIYFMQTETPEYEANKRASDNVSKVRDLRATCSAWEQFWAHTSLCWNCFGKAFHGPLPP